MTLALVAALGLALGTSPAAPAAAPAAPAAVTAEEGTPPRPRVTSVALRLPPGEPDAALRPLLAVAAGDALAPREVRRTVQRLFATGRFADVVARAEEGPDGVALSFECLPKRLVASVTVLGLAPGAPLDAERARRAAALDPGDELWAGRLEDAAGRLRAALARRGWRAAEVRARAAGAPAAVELLVEPGDPTRVEAVDLGAAPPELAAALATRPGAVLDGDALDADVRALRARLRREGFLRARVRAPEVVVEGLRARVRVQVEPGPRVDVRFTGARAFGRVELARAFGLEEEGVLDATALDAGAARVRAFYLANGFAAARATAREVAGPQGVAVVVRVEEGRRYRVRSVRFTGATARDAAWLRARLDEGLELLAPRPAPDDGEAERLARAVGAAVPARGRPPVAAREVWNPAAWDAALLRLAELYRAEGWLDAAPEGTRAALDARSGTVDVEVRLREGVRTRVASVAFEGQETVPLAELAREARLAPGDPLAYGAVEATRAALLDLYARRGHLYARVVDSEELTADRTAAALRFRIEEGPRVRVGSVLVAGARRTREELVRDTVALRAGDVYDPEAAARSQAALLRLGAFRAVGLRLSEPDVPAATKDLTVEVSERPWRTLAPGIGFSLANGPRAFVELTQPNLFGRALELSSRVKVNYPLGTFRPDLATKEPLDRVEGRVDVALRDPRFPLFGRSVGARLDGIAERLHRRAYDLSRGSAVAGLDLPVGRGVTLSLQYELEVDHIRKSNALAGLALTRADVERRRFPEGFTTLHSLRPVLSVDRRDDPLHPRSGWLLGATADYAHSIGGPSDGFVFGLLQGSDVFTHMLKLSAAASGYVPLLSRTVLALSLRAGRVVPLQRESQTIGPKRFFLGGAATMRGYGEDEMIPEDVRSAYLEQVRACAGSLSGLACSSVAQQLAAGQTLVSEGAEAFVLAKAELRLPLGETVEAGFFADAGNLWVDPRLFTLRNLRLDVGVGLRFASPIGPAVLDFGLNASPDGRLGERWLAPHFSIGVF